MNCEPEAKQEVHAVLHIMSETLAEKYVGLPMSFGKVVDGVFNYVPDRVWSFVSGWGGNFVSCAGREVLIKTNAQAVATYPISCFKLPAPVCQKLRTHVQIIVGEMRWIVTKFIGSHGIY